MILGKEMEWISKNPPEYVWEGDMWFNEKDKKTYKANVEKLIWIYHESEEVFHSIPFPKKTKIVTAPSDKSLGFHASDG